MFTGIVEEIGRIRQLEEVSKTAVRLTIEAAVVLDDVQIGDSIAVNGICLTVTDADDDAFAVDVMPETIKASSLRTLEEGSSVNLERSMPANGRFGGHFVTGHVDGTGTIVGKTKQENAVYYTVDIPPELTDYFIMKGSVAVDGVSLTVFGISGNEVTLSLIPHTVSQTVLGNKVEGDCVNVECDVLAKHVHHLVGKQHKQN
ncbi:riboflavin synthase [Lentibacillus cibarius]|uniref:Riboflavin synthase n=1 Tax=Lentibacillus cibarius TaxID=2583219 RepID=A0A549YIA1_9BACI|nr:riboflavin synthase [Lentibacillus cibarius]TRM11594.1 riboflavin synthase [Lentibacillus cibarius]